MPSTHILFRPLRRECVPSLDWLGGIENFADRAAILPDHTKASAHNRVKWTDDCDRAFEDLKRAITSESVLHNPDFSQLFTLQTDTSGAGLQAVPSSGHTWRETSCPVSESQAPGLGDPVFYRGEGVFSPEVGSGVAEILLAGLSFHPCDGSLGSAMAESDEGLQHLSHYMVPVPPPL